jgi:non-canonical purine NTP pyrophosphatase (RdgB/HAM1 family)
MTKLVFVTGNDNKAREAANILGVEIERIKIDLDELQSMDLKVIVRHKAKQAYQKIKKPVIIEDVSFEIEQWGGFPGPFTKWLAQAVTFNGVPALLKKGNRKALWRAMYGYYDGGEVRFFEGIEYGSVALKPRGEAWGFDTIFIPRGFSKTVAELGEQAKATSSARYLALRKLKLFMSKKF